MTDHQFRNAMFGGFNRQDVLDYLTGYAEKNNEEMNSLKERCESIEQELERSREENTQLRAQLEQASRERDEYKNQAEQLTIEIARVSTADQSKAAELEQKNAQLAQVQAELDELRALVSRISPDAEAYAAIKERTAGMELEAHRRAQSVEARARIMAGDLQRQMEQWMAKVEKQYSDLRTEVESSVERANQQILAASGSLSSINTLLEEQQSALKSVVDSYADSVRGKKAE
jgi:chromosome segregation ATPase